MKKHLITAVGMVLATPAHPGLATNGYFARGYGLRAKRMGGVATVSIDQDSEITGAFMVAPRKTATGPSLFNAVLRAGAPGNERVSMRQTSLGLAWTTRF